MVAKARQNGFTKEANKLLENKMQVKQYLKNNSWTEPDMTGKWKTDKFGDFCYGKITNNDIRNSKGVWIIKGAVYVAHFDKNGRETKPWIFCD
jgi:hypothetical protein